MKLSKLKKWVNSLSKEELKGDLAYMSTELECSGSTTKIKKARTNLYYTHDDDPCPLYTKSQLLNDEGYEKDEIEGMTIEIKKGQYYIEF